MKIGAVICEYNPFHLGHAYQISEMKKRGAVIAVMSGSFTQRGDAAVLSKYDRAEIAVRCGADLVLELPFPYSSAPAEIFGGAGVRIAHSLGCVDELCFGSETGDLPSLCLLSERLQTEAFRTALSAYLENDRSQSYRTAVGKVYHDFYGEEYPSDGSNDILSLSYLSALRALHSDIAPVALMRKGEDYNGGGEGFASATTLRALVKSADWGAVFLSAPRETAERLLTAAKEGQLAESDRLFLLFAALVRTRRMDDLSDLYDIPCDLAARLWKCGREAGDMETFLSLVASKNDSPSRVRRAMLTVLMNVKKSDVGDVPYTSVLAADRTGREILSLLRKTARIPIVTKPADAKRYGEAVARAAELSANADAVWELLCGAPRSGNAMIRERPRML
ncbi:MAG: nucleotidyltransferase family protein [Clostridia bacterium]|nr:nucleotidyltransferase family protein [Clostridia bacterium]